MAEPVLAKHLEYIADHERFGHATQARAVEGYERARRTLSNLINADPAQIALNRNATDGINWIAATFPLGPGDEVITSDQEHPAMIYPRSEEHTSELQSRQYLVCRLLLEKKMNSSNANISYAVYCLKKQTINK